MESESVIIANSDDPDGINQVALILTRFCMGLNTMIDGVTTYDILSLMLRNGLTADNATEWGMRIGQTMYQTKSKDKH